METPGSRAESLKIWDSQIPSSAHASTVVIITGLGAFAFDSLAPIPLTEPESGRGMGTGELEGASGLNAAREDARPLTPALSPDGGEGEAFLSAEGAEDAEREFFFALFACFCGKGFMRHAVGPD